MGIAMFTFGGLLAPLQGLVGWFMGPAPAPAIKSVATHAIPARAAATFRPQTRPHRPLRVLRVVDGAHAPAIAGRMVISGRMADVCAELDRLAALEAAR
jgi:hypothetical protein